MSESERPQETSSDGHPALFILLLVMAASLGFYALHGIIEAFQGWAMLFQLPMF